MTPKADASRRAGWMLVSSLLFVYLLVSTRWQGISFYDDSMYMYFGQQFHFSDFVHNLSNAPLYALWFRALSLIFRDAIWRYMASWAMLVITLTTLLLWMKLRLGWLYAVVLLAVPFFSTATYVSFFAAAFLLAGMGWLLRHTASVSDALTLSCFVSFLVTYSRPEFEYGTLLAASAAVITVLYGLARGKEHRAILKMAIVLASSAAVLFTKAHSDSVRSGWAFLQHYNYRAWQAGRIAESPWTSNYALNAFGISTPTATIGDYFHANPSLFLGHVLHNLRDPRGFLLVVGVLLPAAWPWLSTRDAGLRTPSLYLLFVSFPVLASSLLIYPRPHYAVIVFPALLIFALQIVAERLATIAPQRIWLVAIVACALILIEGRQYNHHRRDFDSVIHSNIATIHCERDFRRSHGSGDGRVYDTAMLPDGYGPRVYLDWPRFPVDPGAVPDWPAFRAALQQTHPSWIVTDASTPGSYGMTQTEFSAKISTELGYTPHPCPASSGATIFVPAGR